MAADGSYSYNPTSIPTLETLSLGDHVETFNYSIADGHGDVSSSTLAITVHITPETVTASPDVNDVNEEATLTVAAAQGVLANDTADARSEERRVGKERGPRAGSLGGKMVMAADGSYSYNPTSIPTLETLSLGDHVETFYFSIQDGHDDVASSLESIPVLFPPETVTASPDVNDVNEEATLTVAAAQGVLANDTADA